jgi:hypothetical protein
MFETIRTTTASPRRRPISVDLRVLQIRHPREGGGLKPQPRPDEVFTAARDTRLRGHDVFKSTPMGLRRGDDDSLEIWPDLSLKCDYLVGTPARVSLTQRPNNSC